MFKNKRVQELETKLAIEKFVSENKSLVIRELSESNEELRKENSKLRMNEKKEGILIYREGSTPLGRKYLTLMKIVEGEYQEIDTFENTKTNLKLVKAAGFISDLEYTLDGFKTGVDKIKDTEEIREHVLKKQNMI